MSLYLVDANMTKGEKIKMLRSQNNYSQEKLAELIGVSRQAVAKWELGQTKPNNDNLERLAAIFHVKPDEFNENNFKNIIGKNQKCIYCGKKIDEHGDSFCSEECVEHYTQGIEYNIKNRKWFILGIIISSVVLLASAIVGQYIISSISIMLMAIIIILFPIATPQTYKLLSFKHATIFARILGLGLEALGLWLFWLFQ